MTHHRSEAGDLRGIATTIVGSDTEEGRRLLWIADLWEGDWDRLCQAVEAVDAAHALIVRYWCGDGPDGSGSIPDINDGVARLPERERVALSLAVGVEFPIHEDRS